jgi:hypothetical protein
MQFLHLPRHDLHPPPLDGPDLGDPLPMRPVRVADALYTIGGLCCLHCGRRDHTRSAVGILHLTCTGKACRKPWVALRLPPGTTGAQILELYGELVARAIHRAVCPDADGCSSDALAAWVLPISATDPVYLQRLPDVPEPVVGWHKAGSMLRSLMGNR